MDITGGQTFNIEWLYELRQQRAYFCYMAIAPSGGNFAKAQLYNPVGSLKIAYVFDITVWVNPLQDLTLLQHNVELGTATGFSGNLYLGGAASVMHLRTVDNNQQPGNPLSYGGFAAKAVNTPWANWVAAIPEGQSLLVTGNVAAAQLICSYRWVEK